MHVASGIGHGASSCGYFDSVLGAILVVNGNRNVVGVRLGLRERNLVLLGGGRHDGGCS